MDEKLLEVIEDAIKKTLVIQNPESIKWTLKRIKEQYESKI